MNEYEIVEHSYDEDYGTHYEIIRKSDGEVMTGELSSSEADEELERLEALIELEEIRKSLRDENISYGELARLAELKDYIEFGDVELLEPAGVPEGEKTNGMVHYKRSRVY